jgi:hypothetical protein
MLRYPLFPLVLRMIALLSIGVQSFSSRTASRHAFLCSRALSQRHRPTGVVQRLSSVVTVEPEENIDGRAGAEAAEASVPSNRQLWLDLRSTSLSPQEALTFMRQVLSEEDMDNQEEGQNIVDTSIDRILVSEEIFFKVLKSENGAPQEIDLLYPVQDDLMRRGFLEEESFSMGKILKCEPDTYLDPLLTLDTVSKGGWVVVDPNDEADEAVLRKEQQVSSLLQFLSSASTSSSAGPENLYLPGPSETTAAPRGGIAICCSTQNFLVQMATVMQQLRCGDMLTTSTESGIFLPTSVSARSDGSLPLQTALVLPFDTQLWKIALDMKQMEEDQHIY